MPSRLIEKSAYCLTENMATNKFDVVFSYCGDNIKEFILLLPYNKSLEMYELNDQKIQYLTAPNINIHKMSGNDSNLLIVFYVQIMPDDFVMQLHRF